MRSSSDSDDPDSGPDHGREAGQHVGFGLGRSRFVGPGRPDVSRASRTGSDWPDRGARDPGPSRRTRPEASWGEGSRKIDSTDGLTGWTRPVSGLIGELFCGSLHRRSSPEAQPGRRGGGDGRERDYADFFKKWKKAFGPDPNSQGRWKQDDLWETGREEDPAYRRVKPVRTLIRDRYKR
jgi:hypothetical protein